MNLPLSPSRPAERFARHPSRPSLRWPLLPCLTTLMAICLITCSAPEPSDETPTGDFDRNALLKSLGTEVILPTYRQFLTSAQALETAAQTWRDAQHTDNSEASLIRTEAQVSWRLAMDIWQQAELYQVGPAGSSISVMGGQDLRDAIYSWPTVSACRVDQELVAQGYLAANFFDTQLVNVYGLAALEYLLFHGGTENSCPPQATINSSGAWAELDEKELDRRRSEYTLAAASYLVETASTLVDAWDPAQGNFLDQLARAGEEGSIYGSAQEALDELFAAMYYLDLMVKDMKLAEPAGIADTCPSTTCPEELESPWSDGAQQNLVQNLLGFQKLFLGDDPAVAERVGFDDLLISVDAEALAQTMTQDTTLALQSIAAIGPSMSSALESDLGSVEAAHTAVKTVTDQLKSQFVTVLGLTVPDEGAGDND